LDVLQELRALGFRGRTVVRMSSIGGLDTLKFGKNTDLYSTEYWKNYYGFFIFRLRVLHSQSQYNKQNNLKNVMSLTKQL